MSNLAGPELKEDEWRQLGELYSYGLARGTWSNYLTAERLLRECCIEKGLRLELPLSENTLLAFIHWMTFNRGVKSSTINNYLSGVRQLYISRGIKPEFIRTEKVTRLLAGLKNKEMAEKRMLGTEKRKPITPEILRMLKARISESGMKGVDQRLVWRVSSLIFHGAFRIHELLCREERQFDPGYTLLWQDVMVCKEDEAGEKEVLQLKIKNPKEDKSGSSIIIDVYQTDIDLCPVSALKKWRKFCKGEKDQPLFRFSNGVPLTGKKFNEILRERLRGYVDNVDTLFSSHSFRSGAASMMGTLGYSDKQVKAVGRWGSRAFMEYIRLPRTSRMEVAKAWSKKL